LNYGTLKINESCTMPHYTKPLTKVVKGLRKASKTHAGQAKTLNKILKDQKKGYGKSAKKKKRS